MSSLPVYSVRHSSALISEYFDDEVLVANLLEGLYYSLRFTATDVWKALDSGATMHQIESLIHQQYYTEGVDVPASLNNFIQQLQTHQLIVETATAPGAFILPPATPKKPFVEPDLTVHDDMQDLLALDPIHDVDGEEGWPVRK